MKKLCFIVLSFILSYYLMGGSDNDINRLETSNYTSYTTSNSNNVIILDIKLRENIPDVDMAHITQGYLNKQRWNVQIIPVPGRNDKFLVYLLDSNRKTLFKTAFDFPRVRTIPPLIPLAPDESSCDLLLIEEPTVSLVIPYFEGTKFIEIYNPNQAVPSFTKSIDRLNLFYEPANLDSPFFSKPAPTPAEQGKLHIIIIASGYTSANMGDFNLKAQELENYILSKEPFLWYSSSIDIHIYPNTADLGCYSGCYGLARLMCCTDSQVISAAVASGYLFDEIIVIHNTSTYSGGGYRENLDEYKTNSYNSYAMVYNGSDYYKEMALHEFGHSFGNLCDEYTYSTGIYVYRLCVNCRSDCSSWSTISSACQQGCGARSDYFRPEDSVMRDLSSIDNFNPTSIYATYSPDGLDKRLTYFLGGGSLINPTISLDRNKLNFGGIVGGAASSAQSITISNSGSSTLNWSAASDQNWLNCSPAAGTNSGIVSVSVDSTGLSAGTYTGSITVSDPYASNSPQIVSVTLRVQRSGSSSGPFGDFATPLDGSTVSSSIAVTGWALDDIEVESVKIYSGQIYIGDAIFVDGARPDVEQLYPTYPWNYRAGWGYMLLTNFLPGGGNGVYTLNAIAADAEGNQVTLGSKTITVDNANAVKPFGAIDTPVQGGTVSGSSFKNTGWALTPLPNKIPEDGSTIKLYIDDVLQGNAAVYNIYRADIANKYFPGYANSGGAAAEFTIDTTAFTNGVHSIYWIVTDDAGNADGIGSRYFRIQN